MAHILWMTIDRHPDQLKALIRSQLQESGHSYSEVSYGDLDALRFQPLENTDAVLLAPARHFPKEHMNRLENCALMQVWSSGFDKFNIEDATERKIPVANNHGSNAISVAEHAIFMMLGVARRAPEMHTRVVEGKWAGNDHGMSSFSLKGKSLGIVGLGNIGRLVASRAEALGMKIKFTDPMVKTDESFGWVKVSFDEILKECDYITFHVHSNESTRGMLNLKNINKISRKPFIINVSRAELIEKEALLFALENGIVKGVALDAHYEEPTLKNDPLFSYPNTLFSPHVAGSTVDSYLETVAACLSNINRAISGDQIEGRLN
jgi:phosphoglycerate dehydrogenase-like enzyme